MLWILLVCNMYSEKFSSLEKLGCQASNTCLRQVMDSVWSWIHLRSKQYLLGWGKWPVTEPSLISLLNNNTRKKLYILYTLKSFLTSDFWKQKALFIIAYTDSHAISTVNIFIGYSHVICKKVFKLFYWQFW